MPQLWRLREGVWPVASPELGGTGTVPPTPSKGHFCKSPRAAEKKSGGAGG